MTIQEAIKSGHAFRRRGWSTPETWIIIVEGEFLWEEELTRMANHLDAADILATDWEIKP